MGLLYLAVSTAFFLGGFLFALAMLRSGQRRPAANFAVMGAGFLFQCLFLSERGDLHGRCPITNGPEVLIFIGWSLVIMYFVVGKAFRLSLLGLFTAPIVFSFQLLALAWLALSDPGARPPDSMDPWLEMHAATSLLAYGAFGLAAVAGLMYFAQDRQLKSRKPGRLSRHLPPIRYLIDALVRLLVVGQILITIGIASAFFMEQRPSALHFGASGAVWLIYLILLLVQRFRPLVPRTLSGSAVVAFVIAVVTLFAL